MNPFSAKTVSYLYSLGLSALAALIAVNASLLPAHAQGTHLWTQSHLEEFEKGTPQGIALGSDGHLRVAAGVRELATTPSTYVWSIAVDKNGIAYAGTSSPASILRISADGKIFSLFESKDLSVQAVEVGPDGALYVATLPTGKVYRINPDATSKQDEASATVVFDASKLEGIKFGDGKSESKPHFIWDLTFDAAGRLYIAAGGPAAVYRVDPSKPEAKAETFFQCDEQHIRSLAWDGKGNLIAGTDGSGLVYRISPSGKGYVLFNAPKREITAVAVAANGTIYASSVGDKSHNPLPTLPVQTPGNMNITYVQPASMQSANASTSLPEGSEIYALQENQAPRKLWAGKDEIVYALAAGPEGLLALSGNRGRIFRIADNGTFADVAHLDAQQGLSLAISGNALLIGTGNTGRIFRFTESGKHEYASDLLDTGALARFGRVEVQPGSTGYEIWTRTGNVEQPARNKSEWGWSDWQPLKDGVVASPAGRYLQWKAVLHNGGNLGSVGVNYLPVNAAPVVDEVVVVPGTRYTPQPQPAGQAPTINITFPSQATTAAVAADPNATPLQTSKDRTAVTVRWSAHDDNGDDLTFNLSLKGDGESVWRVMKEGLTDKAYSFDAALIPDGGYQIRVTASDAPAHAPGEALTASKESDRFEVDTTAPVITGLRAGANVVFDAEDSFSILARAEYSLDAGPWQYIEPVGGLSDARREHYEVKLPASLQDKPGEHLITVRVYDRHDNIGVAKTVFTLPAK